MLNFRMPTDLDDRKGTYELGSQESASFSGLYRVIQVENIFEEGMFKQILQLVRFNNQGVIISSPVRLATQKDKDGITTKIVRIDKFRNSLKQLEEMGEFNFGRVFKNLIRKFFG